MVKRFSAMFCVIALLVMGLLFTAQTPALAQTYTIHVVVHGGIADPFWKVFEQGVRDAAANHDDLTVNYSGPPVYNFTHFMSDIESALAARPDALVCTLTEPDAMDEVLRDAIARGMPVIAVNAPDLREPAEGRIPVLTYIGEDSYFMGVTAAQEALARFTPNRAIYVNHHPGARHIQLRGDGFVDTMKAHGVTAEQLNIGEDAASGAEIAFSYMQTHPDTDLIFSGNTLRTEAIMARLKDEGVEFGKDIMIAQLDISPQILEFITNGEVMFTLDQQQYMQGYLGVELAYLRAKFGLTPPPAPVSTGPAVITSDDVEQLEELAAKGYR